MNAYSTLCTNISQATYHAPRLHVPCTTIHHYPTCTNNCHHMQIKLREAYFACVFLVISIISVLYLWCPDCVNCKNYSLWSVDIILPMFPPSASNTCRMFKVGNSTFVQALTGTTKDLLNTKSDALTGAPWQRSSRQALYSH